jgi:hypothetical protein
MAGKVSQGSGNQDRAVVDQLKMLRILFSIFNVVADARCVAAPRGLRYFQGLDPEREEWASRLLLTKEGGFM